MIMMPKSVITLIKSDEAPSKILKIAKITPSQAVLKAHSDQVVQVAR